jgi:hypothetical protein
MRILRQQIIEAKYEAIYVYGDDRTQRAYRGQAEECCGCPNAYPIFTKLLPCKDSAAYLNDYLQTEYSIMIFNCIQRARSEANGRKIIVLNRIGAGCAELPARSPRVYAYMIEQIRLHLDPHYRIY